MIKVYKLEGYRGLWKGLIPTIIGHIPSSVIYYVGYDYLKEYLHEPLHNINMEKYVPIFAGSLARCNFLIIKVL
jgi:solute carrier family 25 protein 39/40